MKLKELKDLIHSNLTLIKGNTKLVDICCYSELFDKHANDKVIGVRAQKDYVVISLDEH